MHSKTIPFILMGQSGGSSQVAYSLAHYGMDSEVDMAIMCSGPPHASNERACFGSTFKGWSTEQATLRINAGDLITTTASGVNFVDYSYGADTNDTAAGYQAGVNKALIGGPENRGFQDSVVNGVAKMNYPNTDLRFLWGDGDTSGAVSQGRFYSTRVKAKTLIESQTTGSVTHVNVPGSTSGSAFIISWVESATLNH